MTTKEYVTHSKDKRTGICYTRKRTEEYLGRCKEHNKKKDKVKVVIIDNNPISIAGYMEEYGDDIFKEKKNNE